MVIHPIKFVKMSDSPTAGILNRLLTQKPIQVWFDSEQTHDERKSVLEELGEEADRVILHININCGYFDPETFSLKCEKAADLMICDDCTEFEEDEREERSLSYYWGVRIYPGKINFYDFNGFPGDNEDGGGAYVNPETNEIEVIFCNSDTMLSSKMEEFNELVQKYENVRNEHVWE